MLKIITKDEQEIQISQEIQNFSILLQDSDPDEAINILEFDAKIIKKAVEFYEIHKFDQSEFETQEFNKKVVSNKFEQNMSSTDLHYVNEFIIKENDYFTIDLEAIAPLVDCSYYLDLKELKHILLKAMAIQFFCGTSDQEIENYKKKFDLKNELSYEEQQKLMNEEFKQCFEQLNQKFIQEMENESSQ